MLLSCGSWAREVLEKDEHLGTLTVIGPEKFEDGGEERCVSVPGKKLTAVTYEGRRTSEGDVPLYISVDKDVMSTSECITNWDQGDLTTDELCALIESVSGGRRIIGADICGGISESDPGYDGEAASKNTVSDIRLIQVLGKIMGR